MREPQKAETKHLLATGYFSSAKFESPLPSPECLKAYSQIIPNSAERLLVMIEKEQAHRINSETLLVKSQVSKVRTGQLFGFVFGVFGTLLGSVLGLLGQAVLGSIIVGTTVGSVACAFIIGQVKQENNDKQK